MSIIKIENITKIYNETKVPVNALNGVSFEICSYTATVR